MTQPTDRGRRASARRERARTGASGEAERGDEPADARYTDAGCGGEVAG
ncbi:hypothetical protein [Halomarina oriensis]|uniref:Uncharacterized protein n=1 Tax=Halomarina oriensis TaxID=671145 RepID=A0A6B0GN47_9EURY|nr:hypothetical protein [Halomarina oriensis]MWG34919.1 hypothetical protein [Halomarina oriensis]